jgi:trehalose-6-phosphate synthase
LMPEARVDSREGVIDYQGRNILTGVYPISIDFKKFDEMARNPIIDPETLHTGKYVIFSHQRLDYTKGIPEMLRAYYNFLTTHWRNSSGNIVLVLVGAPSRVHVTGYKMTNRDVNNQVNFINQEIGQGKWKPVEFKNEALPHEKIVPYLVRADIYIMNSIAEGMGLNSKEFALCNYHKKSARGRGLLIQSELAGVADELGPYSILVDPYNSKEISDAIMEGLHLPRGKRDSDIAAMRNHIKRRDGHYWLRTFMTDIMSIYEHEL